MNMDQVLVCVYTDRYEKTQIVGIDDLWDLLISESPDGGPAIYSERNLDQIFRHGFSYPHLTQAVLNGDINDWEIICAELNANFANRSPEGTYYGDSREDHRAVYGFVNAGTLDLSLFSRFTWSSLGAKEPLLAAPTDFKLWVEARKNNYVNPVDAVEIRELFKCLGITTASSSTYAVLTDNKISVTDTEQVVELKSKRPRLL